MTKWSKIKILNIVIFLLNALLFFFVIYEKNKIPIYSYKLKEAQTEVFSLQNENSRLKKELANLMSQSYLTQKANEIGLIHRINMENIAPIVLTRK